MGVRIQGRLHHEGDDMVDKAKQVKDEAKKIKDAVPKEIDLKESTDTADKMPDEEKTTAKAGKRSAKAIKEAEEKEAKTSKDSSEDKIKPKAVKPARSKIERRGKKYRESAKLIDSTKSYSLKEAIDLACKTSTTKFDSSIELHIRLNVDPKQADQNVRDTVVLPEGTGKKVRVAVFAEEEIAKEAKTAGAYAAGIEEIIAKIEKNDIDFDVLISTPDQMAKLSRHARVLGPRGLMPSPKSGTVTTDVKKAIKESLGGKVEYRVDGAGIIHIVAGKVSFGADKLENNLASLIDSIKQKKPSSIKGPYVRSIYLTTSMGPSVKVDTAAIA